MTNEQRGTSRDNARFPGQRGVTSSRGAGRERGRYFAFKQVPEAYPVFTLQLLGRLVDQRRIPFSRAGRCIVLAEADIEAYLEADRVEPPAPSLPWNTVA